MSNKELYHSDIYLGEEYSDGIKHWKYIKKEVINGKTRYYYDMEEEEKEYTKAKLAEEVAGLKYKSISAANNIAKGKLSKQCEEAGKEYVKAQMNTKKLEKIIPIRAYIGSGIAYVKTLFANLFKR